LDTQKERQEKEGKEMIAPRQFKMARRRYQA
jgi:hypothetical protein